MTETDSTAMGRFQLLDNPVASPGKDAITGRASGPVVDTGLYVEGYGRIYIGVESAQEMGRVAGLIGSEELTDAMEEINRLEAELTERQRELDDLRTNNTTLLTYALTDALLDPRVQAILKGSDGTLPAAPVDAGSSDGADSEPSFFDLGADPVTSK